MDWAGKPLPKIINCSFYLAVYISTYLVCIIKAILLKAVIKWMRQ